MTRAALVLAVALAVALAGAASALDLGARVPAASHAMADVHGRPWTVEAVAGERGTLVMFICVHCPWVQRWNTRIAALAALAKRSGIGVIALNANDPSRMTQDGADGMRRQIEANAFEFPYVIDAGSVLARAYGAQRTPEAFLFDASGALAYHGTIDDNANDPDEVGDHFLRDAIEAVAAGETPALAQTKALGCTIKMYPEP